MDEQTRTHWKRLVNPDYIGVYALPNGSDDLTVTIDYVSREDVKGTDGKKEECTVAHLVKQKPLILNMTNSKSIHKLYGPFIENWAGKQITLFASTTKAFGENVECLRVRPQIPAQRQKPSITGKRFEDALQSIRDKKYTVERLENSFTLTVDQWAVVNSEFGESNA